MKPTTTKTTKQYAAYTYCNFGEPGRKDILRKHGTLATALRAFPFFTRIYSDLHGWRCWQETAEGTIINDRTP